MIATDGEAPLRRRAPPCSPCPRRIPTLAFVLVDDGRPPVRLRGGPGHRRAGPAAAGDRGRRSRTPLADGHATATTSSTRLRRIASAPRPCSFFDGSACRAATTATSRPARRCGWRRCCRYALGIIPARRLPARPRRGRHARRRGRRPHRGAHHARIDELTRPDRRHQAPGQDRHRRHLAHRRDPARGRRWSGRSSRRCGARRLTLPRPCARWPTSRPPSPRSSATPATGSKATRDSGRGDADHPRWSTGRGIALDLPLRTDAEPGLRGTKHQVAIRPEGARRPRSQRRPHHRHRARGEGRSDPGSPCCTCTSPTAARPLRPEECSPATATARRPARRRHRDRADVSATTSSPRSRSPTLLTLPVSVPRRPLALLPHGRWTSIGVGIDLVDVDRFRGLARPDARRASSGCSPPGERAYAERPTTRTERYAARFAAKEAVMKALGVGLGAFGFHDVEVVRAEGGRPSRSASTEPPDVLAIERGVAGGSSASPTPRRSGGVRSAWPDLIGPN